MAVEPPEHCPVLPGLFPGGASPHSSVLPSPSCAVSGIACRSENLGGGPELFCYTNAGRIIFKLKSLLNRTFFSGKVLSGTAKQSKVVCAECTINRIDAKSFLPI